MLRGWQWPVCRRWRGHVRTRVRRVARAPADPYAAGEPCAAGSEVTANRVGPVTRLAADRQRSASPIRPGIRSLPEAICSVCVPQCPVCEARDGGQSLAGGDLPRLSGRDRTRGSLVTVIGRPKRGKSYRDADKIDEMSVPDVCSKQQRGRLVAAPLRTRKGRWWTAGACALAVRRRGPSGLRGRPGCRRTSSGRR